MKYYTAQNMIDIAEKRVKGVDIAEVVGLNYINGQIQNVVNSENWWFNQIEFEKDINSDSADSDDVSIITIPENIEQISWAHVKDETVEPEIKGYKEFLRLVENDIKPLNGQYISLHGFLRTMSNLASETTPTAIKFFSGTLGTGKVADTNNMRIFGRNRDESIDETATLADGTVDSANTYLNIDNVYKSAVTTGTISMCESNISTTVSLDASEGEFTFTDASDFKAGNKFCLDDSANVEMGYCSLTIDTVTTTTSPAATITVKEDVTGYADYAAKTVYRSILTLSPTKIFFETNQVHIYPVTSDLTMRFLGYKKVPLYSAKDIVMAIPLQYINVIIEGTVQRIAAYDKDSRIYSDSEKWRKKFYNDMKRRNNMSATGNEPIKSDVNISSEGQVRYTNKDTTV